MKCFDYPPRHGQGGAGTTVIPLKRLDSRPITLQMRKLVAWVILEHTVRRVPWAVRYHLTLVLGPITCVLDAIHQAVMHAMSLAPALPHGHRPKLGFSCLFEIDKL